jgi:hypothetical protein
MLPAATHRLPQDPPPYRYRTVPTFRRPQKDENVRTEGPTTAEMVWSRPVFIRPAFRPMMDEALLEALEA